MRSMPALLTPAIALLVSCVGPPLATSGEVAVWINRDDPTLGRVALGLAGLSLRELPRKGSWSQELETGTGPDLVLAEWNRDIEDAAEAGLLLDLSPYWRRVEAGMEPRGAFKGRLPDTRRDGRWFLPASLHPWILLSNKPMLERLGIPEPESLWELERAFEAIKANGIIPLALGAAYGYPALAWLSILDLRLNGPEAHRRLLAGKRGFDEPETMEACATLQRWRDRGWIDGRASTTDWTDALREVEEGRAAFVYLPSSALARATRPQDLALGSVPAAGTGGKRGELAAVRGFVLSARATAPEAALALARAYVRELASGGGSDPYQLAAHLPKDKATSKEAGDFRAAASRIADGADSFLPQMDWMFPAQASYDMRLLIRDFLSPDRALDAAALALALARASGR